MKSIFVLGLCVVAAWGMSVPGSLKPINDIRDRILSEEDKLRIAPALEQIYERSEDGEYTIKYKTLEGTEVYEKGWFVPNANGTDKVLNIEGYYSYKGQDGKIYTTKYQSTILGGFQAEGEHLPKSVPES